jgi:hypothetical protein
LQAANVAALSIRCTQSNRRSLFSRQVLIAKSDYDAFERLLGDIQAAYSAEDLSALRAKVAPFGGNARRGLINRVTDLKLLRGDLAEAQREGDSTRPSSRLDGRKFVCRAGKWHSPCRGCATSIGSCPSANIEPSYNIALEAVSAASGCYGSNPARGAKLNRYLAANLTSEQQPKNQSGPHLGP